MSKRVLCILLALSILALPLCAFAADATSAGGEETIAGAAQAIREGLFARRSEINLRDYGLSVAQLRRAVDRVLDTEPAFFYVSRGYGYRISSFVTAIVPNYLYDAETTEGLLAECDRIIEKLLESAENSWSDVEKALYVNDVLAVNFRYDHSYSNFDMYSFLTEGTGVCQAYTLTAIELFRRLGMEADAVVSDSMGHTWNVVKVDGVWYHLDVTWDDPASDRFGQVQHDNFLLSDEGIAQADHYDWSSLNVPGPFSDTRFDNAFWKGVGSPFVRLNGFWYFYHRFPGEFASGIYRSADLESFENVKREYTLWPVSYLPGFTYNEVFSGLFAHGGALWYNTPYEIRTYDPATGKSQAVLVHRAQTQTDWLFGIRKGLDGLSYALDAVPIHEQNGDGSFDGDYTVVRLVLPGDVNGDDRVDLSDLTALAKSIAGWDIRINAGAADLTRDGTLELNDLTLLAKSIAGWDVSVTLYV